MKRQRYKNRTGVEGVLISSRFINALFAFSWTKTGLKKKRDRVKKESLFQTEYEEICE